ncbi:MAG: DUF362 domain-containing protein [Paludibacter sp.]
MKPLNSKKSLIFWVVGFFAFLWVVLRSGTSPKRLTYPCQQALYPIASSWLIALLALVGGSYALKKYTKITAGGIVVVFIAYFVFVFADSGWAENLLSSAQNNQQAVQVTLPVWEVANPVSKVFALNNIPATSGSLNAANATVPNQSLSDPAIDTLCLMMKKQGLWIHKTAEHPNGIVGSDNVVIIKGNFQWDRQNSTNTDRIKGLINQIINHPSGFTGEILVCDNTQNLGSGINENDNNSDDTNQSIADVVNTFHAKGYPVYLMNWNTMYSVVVNEYSQNDMNNGYVYETSTKISYPKFRMPSGNYYVSLRYGIWDNNTKTYDHDKLCIINFPVLKAHGYTGATIAIKNWIGVLTTAYNTERYGSWNNMHFNYFFTQYALVARVMAVTYPKLCIVDAIWTSARTGNVLSDVIKTNCILASTDPVAIDWYSSKYVLTPIAIYPNNTDPDLTGSTFHTTLTNWASYLKDQAGYPVTMNANEISVYNRSVLSKTTGLNSTYVDLKPQLKCYVNQNGNLRIETTTKKPTSIKIDICDLNGKYIDNIINNKNITGYYSIDYNTSNLKQGMYLISMNAGKEKVTDKTLISK